MSRTLHRRLFALAAPVAALLSAALVAHAELPPLPGPGGPAGPASAHGEGAPPASGNVLLERVRRGIVTIERDGRPTGVGTVLSGDGRVLTSLSTMGNAQQADVRYADGSTAHVKIGHKDPAWDLALLVPQSGHWTEGLMASEVDPATARQLAAFTLPAAPHGPPMPSASTYKGRLQARSRAGDLLVDALDLDVMGAPAFGTPIVDATGSVIGVWVKGCRHEAEGATQPGPCVEIPLGAPIPAVRRFLVSTPATATTPQPWLGIRGEADTMNGVHGVRVLAVAPQSPAEKSGLKPTADKTPGDLIVAVEGEPVDSPEKLGERISKHGVGDTIKLLVLGTDHFREVSVQLRAAALQ